MDDVFFKINGERHYLSHAVDQDGDVLDILVHTHRDRAFAVWHEVRCAQTVA